MSTPVIHSRSGSTNRSSMSTVGKEITGLNSPLERNGIDVEKLKVLAGEEDIDMKDEMVSLNVDDKDPFCCAEWEPNSIENPMNFSSFYRFNLSILVSALCFCATFASSLPSGAFTQIEDEFNSAQIETTLVTSIFVLGYVIGLFWSPLSERYGRRLIFIITFSGFTIFTLPCALATNITTILVCRFLSGLFAASSLSNSGATIADIYSPRERGLPFAAFSLVPTVGPLVAPLCSSFLASRYGFRPIFWLQFTFSGLLTIAIYLGLPETYAPLLLQRRAAKLRISTGDSRYWAKLDKEVFTVNSLVTRTLGRPIVMLFTEPIVAVMSFYLSVVYGVIYLSFELYPAVFQTIHGFSSGIASIPFLAVALGVILGAASVPWYYEKKYRIAFELNGNKPNPEQRLTGLFYGAPAFTIGLWWFGWTSSSHWIVPTLAGIPLGYGIFHTFQGCLNYIVDCYSTYTASALAAAQAARATAGFIFPIFSIPMLNKLGVPLTATVLGSISLALVPMPFIFHRYGPKIRAYSKMAF